ncbi:MAG: hypothetical protein DMF56_17850 [Acidobacteria bacterium]|nr:MAG: hypothetical protein DMF56_17850 [Acidobacteriota bacterium]
MKHLALVLLLFSISCKQETVVTETVDTREPVGVLYVASPAMPVREKPDDKATVVATYQSGEAISVLAKKGDWAEVRTGGGSGWAKLSDLMDAEAKKQVDANPDVRFRIMPLPVSAPSAHGEIYIRADVNSDGEVVGTQLIVNTTGSPELAAQNEQALKSAKFYPIIQKNERKPFQYFHKVTY